MVVRRLLPALVAVVAAALLGTGLGALSPAYAAGGRVTSSSATLYRNCFWHPFSYAVSGVGESWTLSVRLVAAGGRVVDRATVPASAGRSGRGAFRICAGRVRPGTYTVRSAIAYDDAAGHHVARLADDRLVLRRPRTATAIAVSPRRPRPRAVVRVRASVKVARPFGSFAQSGVRVKAYVRHHGSWRRVGAARRTNAAGRATFRIRWRWTGRHKVKVVTGKTRYHARSASRAVVVRTRTKATVR